MKTKPAEPAAQPTQPAAPTLAETKPLSPIMHPDSLARIQANYQAWLRRWKEREAAEAGEILYWVEYPGEQETI